MAHFCHPQKCDSVTRPSASCAESERVGFGALRTQPVLRVGHPLCKPDAQLTSHHAELPSNPLCHTVGDFLSRHGAVIFHLKNGGPLRINIQTKAQGQS